MAPTDARPPRIDLEGVHVAIAAQAARTPDATAVICGEHRLSYGELDRRANQLAHRLQREGVGPDGLVGLAVDRGLEMITGLLGILKAGGAYVPLDPAYPRSRLAFVLEQSGVGMIVTQAAVVPRLPRHDGTVLRLDTLSPEIAREPAGPPPGEVTPDHLAYVIYTSGSTGRPKGVQITHANLVNFLESMRREPGISDRDTLLAVTTLSFDIAGLELFLPLCVGARVVIARRETTTDGRLLQRVLHDEGITMMQATPATWHLLLQSGWTGAPGFRMLCGGEALPRSLADALLTRGGGELWNMYGPTETTIWSSTGRVTPGRGPVALGQPIANTDLLVLADDGATEADGREGELFIGGDGLARGYLRRPDLTAERFVPDPRGGGRRLYRTGDAVRRRADGALDFLGRVDHQVKIRGFRIELGEIEATLSEHAAVRTAVATVRDDGPAGKQLVAAVTAHDHAERSPDALRAHLEERLPDYMIPAHIVVLDRLPLTPNGKIDRSRVADLAAADRRPTGPLVAARTPTEQAIVDAFLEVLPIDRVGIHDAFNDLGGHSLLAAQLVSRLRDRFDIELPVSAILSNPTVADLAATVDVARTVAAPRPGRRLERRPRDTRSLPLSFGQQRLWFLDQIGAGAAYNMAAAWRLLGPLDVGALERALHDLVERHETLRSRFPAVDGKPFQVVDPPDRFALHTIDLTGEPAPAARAGAERVLAAEMQEPFDLADGPVFRVTLVAVGPEEHLLVAGIHHIVCDGWSLDVLRRDLLALYAARLTGADALLPAVDVQYADYAAWDHTRLEDTDVVGALLDYWRANLADLPTLELPTDQPRPVDRVYGGRAVDFEIPETTFNALQARCREHGVTPAMALQAAYTALLHRYCDQDDVVIGAAVASRNQRELEDLVGFFVDSLVLRVDHGGDPDFAELLTRTRRVALDAYDHQDLPFERLVDELRPDRDLSMNPLFQVAFIMENAPTPSLGPATDPTGLSVAHVDPPTVTSRFDLALHVFEAPDGLAGRFVYDTSLFNAETVARMATHFLNLLQGALGDPTTRLSALPLMSDDERSELLDPWTTPTARLCDDPEQPGILSMVAHACDLAPDAPAICTEGHVISYRELDTTSSRVARVLRSGSFPDGGIVAVCLRDRAQLITAMLGIWRAGGVFVPLDPAAPDERLDLILSRVHPARLIVGTEDATRLGRAGRDATPPQLTLDAPSGADWFRGVAEPSGARLDEFDGGRATFEVDPGAASYVYHTSGSTGQPKGITGTLRSLAHFVRWEIDTFGVHPGSRVSQLTVPTFDPFFRDVLVPLCAGGAVCVPPERIRLDPPALLAWLESERVTLAHCVPSLLALLAALPRYPGNLPDLAYVLLAGEVLPVDLVRKWRRISGDRIRLVNIYGPTETTMAKLHHVVVPADLERGSIPIGRPIRGARVLVVGRDGSLRPRGTVGELLIRTPYLTLGYHGDPEATQRSFVPNPFGRDPDDLVYRTGDLGRMLEDGSIQFVGRRDNQVKIRGRRVELEEIEKALRQLPGVQNAVVICREDQPGVKRLVAYVVGSHGEAPDRGVLWTRLRDTLPEYMVPAAFVLLDELPLNRNGKIDRRALPVPSEAPVEERSIEGPRDHTETVLAEIWRTLLGLEQVGIHENFFRLGGDSILAIQIVARACAAGLRITPQLIFRHQTIADLAAVAAASTPAATDGPTAPRPAADRALLDDLERRHGAGSVEDVYPLAPMQQGMVYHSVGQEGTGVYVQQRRLSLDDLDVETFRAAWARAVERHAVLRTGLAAVDTDAPRQFVRREIPTTITEHDRRDLDDAERERWIESFLEQDRARGFDLTEPPLWRLALIRVGDDRYECVCSHHHLLLDGWSGALLWNDVLAFYDALRRGVDLPVACPPPYRDYIDWLERQDLDEVDAYWRGELDGFTEATTLGIDGAPGRMHDGVRDYDAVSLTLAEDRSSALRSLAARCHVTLNGLLLGLWSVLLSRYSGRHDVLFGTVVSGRQAPLPGVESIVGLLINTLPTRVRVNPGIPFDAWIEDLQQRLVRQRDFEHGPLWRVRKQSALPSDAPLFESLFVFENYPRHAGETPAAPRVGEHPTSTRTGYPLTMVILPEPALHLRLTFDRDRFDQAAVATLARHYVRLLEAALTDPAQPLGALGMLDETERRRIVQAWNGTAATPPDGRVLHELFEDAAASNPGRVAVQVEHDRLTYETLNTRANQLARHLHGVGVGPGARVGLCLDRSVDLIVGMLGILKAGGAFVPLDPDHPPRRLAELLEDAGAAAVVSVSTQLADLPAHATRVVALDADGDAIAARGTANLPTTAGPSDLAYVIHTSGTTGRPKGVAIEHRNLVNYLHAITPELDLPPAARLASVSPLTADLGHTCVFGALCFGGCLHLVTDERLRDPDALGDYLDEHEIDVLKITPSHLLALLGAAGEPRRLLPRRLLMVAGEPCPVELAARVADLAPECVLINSYGPTETTVGPIVHRVGAADRRTGSTVPIGRPIANIRAHVLDRDLHPLPAGVPGELCLAGAGVARGYLGRPALTAERFVPNPFALTAGERLYRTGDLACYRRDGTLAFVGRIDRQVKIRGHRIEPAEIEGVLRTHPSVRDAAVEPHTGDDGRTRLVAYLVTHDDRAALLDELRVFLGDRLPPAMLPAALARRETLPRTASGKVDRRALALGADDDLPTRVFREPRTDAERALAAIWSRVLRIEGVGIDDNFFELGGDSILMIQIIARAREAGLHLAPRSIFDHPTVAALAAVATTATAPVVAEQGPVVGALPLTPIDHRFFERDLVEPAHFNNAMVLTLRERIDAAQCEQAAQHLYEHHDALRLRFRRTGTGYARALAAATERVPFVHVDLAAIAPAERGAAITTHATELQASFDLDGGPLVRVALFDQGPSEPQRLLLVIHHLAIDGVSWRIVLEDFETACTALSRGTAIRLAPKTTSVRAWSTRLSDYAATTSARAELDHWSDLARTEVPALPVAGGAGTGTVGTSETVTVALTESDTDALLRDVPHVYNTQINDALLTALVQAFAAWTGHARLYVDLEGHGREALFDDVDVSRTVGWFTSIYPVLLMLDDPSDAARALKSVKEQLRVVPNRGLGYGVLRYLSPDDDVRERLAALPPAAVSFNYLGQFDQVLDDAGLLTTAPESAGPNMSPRNRRSYRLTINSEVRDGCLRARWSFCRTVDRRETIERLAAGHLDALRDLIEHCRTHDAGGYTPSDFPQAGLDQDDLDALVARIGGATPAGGDSRR